MRSELTPDEITFYRDNGFVVVPDLLDADELEVWRAAVDAAVAERSTRMSFDQWPHEAADEFYEKVFTQRVNLWQTNDAVKDVILDSQLGRLAAELAGVDGIRVWHDQALVKEPYGNPTAFHLDVPYWSFTSADAITVWVALDDATLENGALYYVPGSHKAQRFDNVGIGKHIGALFEVYPEWQDVKPVACPVPAGGATFHSGLTAHGAGANMTPGRRRAMTCAYMPDGATFNGTANVIPPHMLERLAVGDRLDDESQNPLVWARAAVPAG
jgi:ectoine hydroxylase-related dioxygenase (phytanoyl-CoA dioxygenase family)